MGSKFGVVQNFCHWARSKFTDYEAGQYIRTDIHGESDDDLRTRLEIMHPEIWAEFVVYYARLRVTDGK